MRKTRLTAIILIMMMIISMFAGCGGGRSSDEDEGETKTKKTTEAVEETDEEAIETKETDENNGGGLFGGGETTEDNGGGNETEKTEGTELSDFVTKYTDAKQVIWDKISDQLDSSSDLNASMAMLGFAFADMAIVIVPFFDTVEYTGGTMMFSEINNAYKKVNGDKITFGYDYTYDKDTDNNKTGDHVFCEGLFDMGQQSMTVEIRDESDGKVSTRTIVEIQENKNGSFSSQLVSYTDGNENISGYFTTFEGEDLWSRMAEKTDGPEFTFNTMIGNKTATLDELTAGFTVKTEVSYVDGEAKVVQSEE